MAKKLLNGTELAAFIKQRQLRQVRMLRQAHQIQPKLVIIQSIDAGTVIQTYVRMKEAYAADIGIETQVITTTVDDMPRHISESNADSGVYAIVIQLPIGDPDVTESIVSLVDPAKDVDGLGPDSHFISATAEAIDWLISGYSIDLKSKKIAILGRGKLVGAPLEKLWLSQGLDVTTLDRNSKDIDGVLSTSDVIVSATGKAGILHDGNVPKGAIVVDAGTAAEDGVLVGDSDPKLQVRQDLIITPPKGGVGPLTVCVMFDHVIRACLAHIPKTERD